jgi:hypothetical protein
MLKCYDPWLYNALYALRHQKPLQGFGVKETPSWKRRGVNQNQLLMRKRLLVLRSFSVAVALYFYFYLITISVADALTTSFFGRFNINTPLT